MRILPDSGAYSHLKRVHPRVAELVRISEEVLPSLAVVGELLYGFRNRSRLEKNVHELHAFLDSPRVTIAAMSLGTADRRSGIAVSLRAKGCPVPSNDIRIASHVRWRPGRVSCSHEPRHGGSPLGNRGVVAGEGMPRSVERHPERLARAMGAGAGLVRP